MYKFGYRIKLPNDKYLCEKFIRLYSKYYDTFELKVDDELLVHSVLENIINFSKVNMKDFFSFHIFKDALYNKLSFEKTKKFCEYLENMNLSSKFLLVTHFIDESCIEVPKMKGNNYTIVLENVEVESDLIEYLQNLKSFAIRNNTKICLDLGHLLYSNQEKDIDVLEWIIKDEWWKKNIVEFHIHDYNSEKCHLNLGKGLLDLKNIASFLNGFKNYSIIVETKIRDLSTDGVTEIQYLKERLYGDN